MSEGVRGGKIIGHTSSGKPIYQSATNAKYKDFSARDHHEAYVVHSVMSQRAQNNKDYEAAAKHGKQQAYHRSSFEAHENLGTKIPSYDQSLGRVKFTKSEDSMSKDIFKAMGVTIGQPSLLQESQTKFGTVDTSNQVVRKGLSGNPRDRLEQQLSKGFIAFAFAPPPRHAQAEGSYGAENLKNTHGEEFHSDNDADVESMVTTIGEVDRIFEDEYVENPATDYGCKVGRKRKEPAIQRSLSQEELLLKALDGIGKGMPRVSTKAPRLPKDPEQVREEKKQKKELLGKYAKKSLIEMVPEKTDEDLIANVHENSNGINERLRPGELIERSELDELVDMVKSKPLQQQVMPKPDVRVIPIAPAAKNNFIKSAGPGGMIFDFGHRTGNKIADNATALLNAHGDPVQMGNAEYQSSAYNKALTDFVTKGEQKFSGEATPFGNIDNAWSNQLNKPIDQQVVEAFQKGELTEDRSAPAVKNDHNKTEIKMGGEVIKATSETDALLLKMMQESGMGAESGDPSAVIDATAGGAQRIMADATN